MTKTTDTSTLSLLACEEGLDPIEDRLRANIRGTIEAVFNEELDSFIGRLRYGREARAAKGYRHGHRDRQITGTFGTELISVPRARVENEDGKVREWRSKALPRYQHLTKTTEALIASVYLSGTNMRRVPEWATQSRRTDNALVKALARAFRWKRRLESDEFTTVAELAECEGTAPSYITRVLRLTLLAPDIVEAILDGKQGPEVTLARVLEPLPVEWEAQCLDMVARRG